MYAIICIWGMTETTEQGAPLEDLTIDAVAQITKKG